MMWARGMGGCALALIALALGWGPLEAQQPAGAAQVLVNARGGTGDAARPWAEAVAVVGGRWVHPEEPLSP